MCVRENDCTHVLVCVCVCVCVTELVCEIASESSVCECVCV